VKIGQRKQVCKFRCSAVTKLCQYLCCGGNIDHECRLLQINILDVSRKSKWSDYVPRPKHSGVREKSSIAISPCRVKPRIASNLATNLQSYDMICTCTHTAEQKSSSCWYICLRIADISIADARVWKNHVIWQFRPMLRRRHVSTTEFSL